MSLLQASLNELRYKATFNHKGYKHLANGNTIPVDEKLFDFWYGKSKTSVQYQVKSNTFSDLKGTYQIFTRHRKEFENALHDTSYSVTMSEVVYNIAYLDIDDGVNGFDQITLKKN